MSKLDLGSIGVALDVSADDTHLEEAAELERLGYSTIWLPCGRIDSLDRIATTVRATKTIPVGSAIISPDLYDADSVIELYADVQATAPDRFVLGLGGPQKPRSLQPLSHYLDELDGAATPVPAGRRILAALGRPAPRRDAPRPEIDWIPVSALRPDDEPLPQAPARRDLRGGALSQ